MQLSRTRARLYHKSSHSRRPQDTAHLLSVKAGTLPPVKWSFPDLLIRLAHFTSGSSKMSSNMSKLTLWIGTKIRSTSFRCIGTSVNGCIRQDRESPAKCIQIHLALKSRPKGRKTKRQSKPRCLQHDPTLNFWKLVHIVYESSHLDWFMKSVLF